MDSLILPETFVSIGPEQKAKTAYTAYQPRDRFRLRSKMTKTVKMSYPSDKGYKADLWSYWHCPNLDTQSVTHNDMSSLSGMKRKYKS